MCHLWFWFRKKKVVHKMATSVTGLMLFSIRLFYQKYSYYDVLYTFGIDYQENLSKIWSNSFRFSLIIGSVHFWHWFYHVIKLSYHIVLKTAYVFLLQVPLVVTMLQIDGAWMHILTLMSTCEEKLYNAEGCYLHLQRGIISFDWFHKNQVTPWLTRTWIICFFLSWLEMLCSRSNS